MSGQVLCALGVRPLLAALSIAGLGRGDGLEVESVTASEAEEEGFGRVGVAAVTEGLLHVWFAFCR